MMFNLLSSALFDRFYQQCYTMYERQQPLSRTGELLVYAGMSNLCSEFSSMSSNEAAEEIYEIGTRFSSLLLDTLGSFSMLTPASMESTEALMAAVCIPCKF